MSRILALLLFLVAPAFAHSELRSMPAAAVQPESGSSFNAALPDGGGPRPGVEPKSLANGLYMTGGFTYLISGNLVSVTLDGITNDSFTRTSGTLRVELWASVTSPGRGQGFSGYKLAQSSLLNPLPPRTFYSNLAETVSFSYPPDGTYWLVLVLTEFNPGACPANPDSYCQQDSFISFSQRTFGAPPPPRASLENPQPGSYQSGVGLISGWSCSGGNVAVQIAGRTYPMQHGSSRADTASICGTSATGFGLLVNFNGFGAGTYTAQLIVNGVPQGAPATFTVTVPMGEFARGLSRQVSVPNFPSTGRTTTLTWQESQQNFAIQSVVP